MINKEIFKKETLKVAISTCPNDIFIFSGLLLNRISTNPVVLDFSFFDIQKLNEHFLKNNFDLIKISAIQTFNNPKYQLLSSGGAMGFGCGPLLLSQTKKNTLRPCILLPGRETTANALFDFYNQHKKKQKRFLPFDQLYQELKRNSSSQGVVIHESRFTFIQDGLHCIIDLGKYWEKKTGYPVPLGVLMLKKSYQSEMFEALICKSLMWARDNFEEALNLCLKYAQEISVEVCRSHIQLYVNEFTKNMGKEGRNSLEFLIKNSTK